MNPQVATALISGFAALAVATVSALFAVQHVRRERKRWAADAKIGWSLEVLKARLSSYPGAFVAIEPLSSQSRERLTSEDIRKVGDDLNRWFYGAGGMCAEEETRAAVLGLRVSCTRWAETGSMPKDLFEWRNAAIQALRLDLDLSGLESFAFSATPDMLSRLRAKLNAIDRDTRGRGPVGFSVPRPMSVEERMVRLDGYEPREERI